MLSEILKAKEKQGVTFDSDKQGIIDFLHKNQYTQRKLLNVENWTNGEPQ
jgi:hypothetical protein